MAVQTGVGEEERCPTLQPSEGLEVALLVLFSTSLKAHPAQQISRPPSICCPLPHSPPIKPFIGIHHPPVVGGSIGYPYALFPI